MCFVKTVQTALLKCKCFTPISLNFVFNELTVWKMFYQIAKFQSRYKFKNNLTTRWLNPSPLLQND